MPAFRHLTFNAPYSTCVSTYIFGEVLEVVEHVEPVEVDGARRHRVVRESQRLPQLEDKPVARLLPSVDLGLLLDILIIIWTD